MNTEPTIVVLAAGQGSRYRGPSHKLEQPLGEYGSVLATTAPMRLAAPVTSAQRPSRVTCRSEPVT